MVKLVLLHKADSIYEDEPDSVYDFPKSYLRSVREGIGDWVIYYEPVKAGARGYFAVAKIARVIEKPAAKDRYLALIEPGTFLPFDNEVPRLNRGDDRLRALWLTRRGCPRGADRSSWRCGGVADAEIRAESLTSPPWKRRVEDIEARRYDTNHTTCATRRGEPFNRPVIRAFLTPSANSWTWPPAEKGSRRLTTIAV